MLRSNGWEVKTPDGKIVQMKHVGWMVCQGRLSLPYTTRATRCDAVRDHILRSRGHRGDLTPGHFRKGGEYSVVKVYVEVSSVK